MTPETLTIDPATWQANGRLRACSVAARGLFVEMLVLMLQGDPYGHLAVDGRPLSTREVAKYAGAEVAETEDLLKELDDAGLLRRDGRGRIFSRRLLRTARGRGARR